ncbi:MAG: hypothetical protein WCG67_05600 [Ferruginibacter sp.]
MLKGKFSKTWREKLEKGGVDIAPYWWVLKEAGWLNTKFPGGEAQLVEHLQQEDISMIQKEPG